MFEDSSILFRSILVTPIIPSFHLLYSFQGSHYASLYMIVWYWLMMNSYLFNQIGDETLESFKREYIVLRDSPIDSIPFRGLRQSSFSSLI